MDYDRLFESIKKNDKDDVISLLTSISMIEDDESMLEAVTDSVFDNKEITLEQKKSFITTAASVGISIWCILSSSFLLESDDPYIINHILDSYINCERLVLMDNDHLVNFMMECALLDRIAVLNWIKSITKIPPTISKKDEPFIDAIITIPECKEASLLIKSIVTGV